ncbi:MAG TPA: hypothetical protein VGP72_18340 [Planctomycetota bacterium]|jgi:hypothetical protein
MVVEKKPDPFAKKPNKMLPFIAGAMIVLAVGWTVYQSNPGRMIRSETKEEKTTRETEEKEAANRARHAKKK